MIIRLGAEFGPFRDRTMGSDVSAWSLCGFWNVPASGGVYPTAYFPDGGEILGWQWDSTVKVPFHQVLTGAFVWDPADGSQTAVAVTLHVAGNPDPGRASAAYSGHTWRHKEYNPPLPVVVPVGGVLWLYVNGFGSIGVPFGGTPVEIQSLFYAADGVEMVRGWHGE